MKRICMKRDQNFPYLGRIRHSIFKSEHSVLINIQCSSRYHKIGEARSPFKRNDYHNVKGSVIWDTI